MEFFATSSEVFGTSLDIFGYYRILTKNLGTYKIKNVTPINVKRLAGITLALTEYIFIFVLFYVSLTLELP